MRYSPSTVSMKRKKIQAVMLFMCGLTSGSCSSIKGISSSNEISKRSVASTQTTEINHTYLRLIDDGTIDNRSFVIYASKGKLKARPLANGDIPQCTLDTADKLTGAAKSTHSGSISNNWGESTCRVSYLPNDLSVEFPSLKDRQEINKIADYTMLSLSNSVEDVDCWQSNNWAMTVDKTYEIIKPTTILRIIGYSMATEDEMNYGYNHKTALAGAADKWHITQIMCTRPIGVIKPFTESEVRELLSKRFELSKVTPRYEVGSCLTGYVNYPTEPDVTPSRVGYGNVHKIYKIENGKYFAKRIETNPTQGMNLGEEDAEVSIESAHRYLDNFNCPK